jgi:hypothetical protein
MQRQMNFCSSECALDMGQGADVVLQNKDSNRVVESMLAQLSTAAGFKLLDGMRRKVPCRLDLTDIYRGNGDNSSQFRRLLAVKLLQSVWNMFRDGLRVKANFIRHSLQRYFAKLGNGQSLPRA